MCVTSKFGLNKQNQLWSSNEKLFPNRSKFEVHKKDPILTRLGTVQNYINSSFKRNEISEELETQIWLIAMQLPRAHGLTNARKTLIFLHLEQLSTLPTLLIIVLGNFYHPYYHYWQKSNENLIDNLNTVRKIRSFQLNSLMKVTNIFHLISNHFLPL